MPFTTGLAAAVAVLGVLPPPPALGAPVGSAGTTVRSQEWWLASLHVTQAWPTSEGAGITVAVLGTGVDAGNADLAGGVTTGPDFTGSHRTRGSDFWGIQGTAVAGIIAGHGHGAGRRSGIIGIAPAAQILSVRVTLEFNDPLSSDVALSRRLPQAIADGIMYAVAHGARIIELPLDPGTLGLAGRADPAAAGGSPAEWAAVKYALDNSVVLVAPAGDDGMGPGLVNYPAAYPGVIAVGAVRRGGHLAPFSSRHSYVSLTAPGVGLQVAFPANVYQATSSTSAASGMVAAVTALILSRFPHLTVAQVTRALTESTATGPGGTGLPPLPARSPAGAGYGTVDAVRAIQMAALIAAASQPAAHPVRSPKPARRPVTAPRKPATSTTAGSVLRAALAGVCGLIVLLVVTLLVTRFRRDSRRGTAPGRAKARGVHEHRRPERVPVAPGPDHGNGARPPQVARPGPRAADTWPSPAGWQGDTIGKIAPASASPFAPAVTSAPRVAGYRSSRGAGAEGQTGGPPWAPAPEPGRTAGPLPVASPISPPPDPGRGIRVPGDMTVRPAKISDPSPLFGLDTPTPATGFAASPPDFDLGPPPPPGFGPPPALDPSIPPAPDLSTPPAPDFGIPPALDFGPPSAMSLPPRESLDFAAAPVAADYAAPFPTEPADQGGPVPIVAADPSYIWDLAATDVFPAATGGDQPAETAQSPEMPPPPEGGSGGGGS